EVLPDIPPQTDLETSNFLQANEGYQRWLATNVFEQKQKGWYAIQVKVNLGDIMAPEARKFAQLVSDYAADDIRITVNQGFLIKFVRKEYLPHLFNELTKIGLGASGFNTIADITACPGTVTCNLAVTNSTSIADKLEEVIREEYPHFINEHDMKIKISGCMNACGQHMAADIGLHGSSIKKKPLVIPAMQIVLGGGVNAEGNGLVAERVIKLPTKRIPDALRLLLDDFDNHGEQGEYYNVYFQRQGKMYFYNLLKHLGNLDTLADDELIDWGEAQNYVQAIGVGECAGVAFDVVGTIINDAREKIELSQAALEEGLLADSIYHSYSAMVIGAKALLLSADVKCNTHKGIINDFDTHFVETEIFALPAFAKSAESTSFSTMCLQINKNEPEQTFANTYLAEAKAFVSRVIAHREAEISGGPDKQVVDKYYNA
ncbi:MAG: HEPN domain-containing protein, partial [Bacteroidota bacterium]